MAKKAKFGLVTAPRQRPRIKPKGISAKQYSSLLLELNLVKKAWRPYGVDIQINAPGLKSILKWGTKSLDAKET
jgi:hypothetical protein